MKKKLTNKSAKLLKAFVPQRKGGSSGGGTPATTRPSTPTPASVPGPATPGADPGAGSVTASGTGVDTQASVAGRNRSTTELKALQPHGGGVAGTDPLEDRTIVQEVRDWWKAHRGTILASAQFVLEGVEKGLDGMPVPGPMAAIGAFTGVVKAVRTLDENHASVKEITEKVEDLTSALAQFMVPTLPDLTTTSVSEDIKIRVEEFNARLTKIKTSAGAHPTTKKNVLVRLADAERVSEELKDVWTKIQVDYLHLITMTALSTEQKIDQVQKDLLVDRLKPAHSALFDDAEAETTPSCLKGTRVNLLADIEKWMADPLGKPVYWLTGVAGTGKTTIAQSVAHMAHEKERPWLLGTFFFSRTGAADRRSAVAVIPTLAYQLALKNGLFCSRLCEVIRSKPDIFRKKLEVQAKLLLSDTCTSIPSRFPHPLIIVIDALDECDKQQGVEGGNLIPVLLRAVQSIPFSVKIFITSRPESSIEDMFGQDDLRTQADGLALHRNIEDHVVRGDIGRYLRHELDKIAARSSRVTVPPLFPLEEQFVSLVDRADTLFIYARTALEYISSPSANPRRQIELLLSADSQKGARKFDVLDGLYKHVVGEVLEHSRSDPREIRDVLASLVLLRENMPVAALAALNGMDEDDCETIVRSLASVVLFDRRSNEPVRPIHLSFSDFLFDRNRSTDAYVVHVPVHHLQLAEHCLRIMNERLRKDICDIRDPSLFNTEVADLKQRLVDCVSPQLRYACRFWHVHFELAGTVSVGVTSHLEDFCQKHLLHWLELLSLLDELPLVLTSMTSFLAHLRGFEELQDAHALLSDVVRLAAAYQVPVTASALHVYHSAVVTMPSCRLQELASKDAILPVLVSERPSGWQRILEGHSKTVDSVAYSSDGKYIVSGSSDCTVRVWDTATGIQLQMMTAHWERVRSVMFSGVSKNLRVVSGSDDCTVRVWDAMTGVQLRTMHHEEAVYCVAVSRDGQLIASGSDDGTSRIWDARTGTLRFILNSDDDRAYPVAFSGDSKLVVSGSRDGTLRVWDAATGMQQLFISGHEDAVTYVAFSKDGRSIISRADYGTIRVWSIDTGASVLAIDGPKIEDNFFTPTSHNASLIASGSHDGTIWLWDVTTGHLQHLIVTGHERWITSVAISDDGTFVAVGCSVGPLWVSEITTPTDEQERNQTAHTEEIKAVAFSGDGMFIASGSDDRTVKVWNAKTGVELSTLSGHTISVTSVALSGDGKLVVSGSYDDTVRLWEAKTGTELHVFAGHEYTVLSVALSGDDKLVASGSQDCTMRVWDAVNGTHLYTISNPQSWVTSVAFSNDSSLIISGSYEDKIRIRDAATGTHRQTITGHRVGESVVFSNGGSSIVSRPGRRDGTMRVWEASAVVALDGLSTGTSLPQYVEAPDSPCCDQFKVDEDGWIYRLSARNNWQRVCWLPDQRRGYNFAHFGETVCIGSRNGIITILHFS